VKSKDYRDPSQEATVILSVGHESESN